MVSAAAGGNIFPHIYYPRKKYHKDVGGITMEAAIRTERKDGILIVSPSCRLDEFGSLLLDETIGKEIHDDDRSVVIDMEKVPYLSNAGIRVFLVWKRRTQERKGLFALARVQQFPWQVLHMSGYLPSFALYDSLSRNRRLSRR
jgi:stage II sporulation protein AA (anti-sigma F factor antagonist)